MNEYYDNKPLLEKNGDINVIWGPKMIGKTYSYLKLALENFRDNKRTFVYVKRWNEDVKTINMKRLIEPSLVETVFGQGYSIAFYRGKFILKHEDKDDEVVGWAVAINNQDHVRLQIFNNAQIVILDDFLQVRSERTIPYEFDCWESILYNITRDAPDAKVFILGNVVTKCSPYFIMYNIKPSSMQPGEIKVIKDGPIRIVAQYCKIPNL